MNRKNKEEIRRISLNALEDLKNISEIRNADYKAYLQEKERLEILKKHSYPRRVFSKSENS